MSTLEPDQNQIEIFAEALFRYAPNNSFVSLRAFYHDNSVFRITPVRLDGNGLRFLCDAAEDEARRAAQAPKPVVFCPPIAVFSNKDRAREADLAAGLAMSAELDQHPHEALTRLEEILGPATIVVRSGGIWIDPDGNPQDKLHAHWRLARPACGENLAKLKDTRKLATRIAGGDASSIPAVHPLRWPGSWHRKDKPRLCEIARCDPDREIDLDEAIEALQAAAPAEQAANGADRDTGPYDRADWATLIGNIIAGRDLHASDSRLASSCATHGMTASVTTRVIEALYLASNAPHDERWKARFDDIPRSVRTAYAKYGREPAAGTNPDEAWQWRFFGRQQDIVERLYLVEKLLPETGVGLISGQWGTYKTFAALDLAAAVITGTPFAGFDIARQGAVLFIAMEGQGEVDIRMKAALAHRGYTEPLAPFAWIDTCPRLLDQDAGEGLSSMVKQAAAELMQQFGLPTVLAIVDTAGKAAGYTKAGDENDAVLARQLMAALAEASRGTGALFLGIDHFGKAAETGTRGSSAKEADCDAVLALLGDKNIAGEVTNPRLAIRKRRSGANGVELPFRTKVVQAGDLPDDTTLVVEWLQSDEVPAPKADAWPKSLRLLRQTLMNVLVDHGTDQRPFLDGPTVRAVDIETVRSEFYAGYPADGDQKKKADARRQAFNRAVQAAQINGVIGVRDIGAVTFVWLAKPEMKA